MKFVDAIGGIEMARTLGISALLASGTSEAVGPTLVWIAVLIGAAVAGGFILVRVKKSVRENDESGSSPEASLLERARELHRRGEVSDSEFETLRRALGARVADQMGVLSRPPAQTGNLALPPRPIIGPEGEVRAAPGFDLTGRRLPKPPTPG